MEGFSRALIALAIILIILAFFLVLPPTSCLYTSAQIAAARSHGVYDSAEQAMLALVDSNYAGVSRVAILYAGPNSFDGSKPYVWYVIAKVRAARRTDGSAMGPQGCDAPGSYFIQTKEGWVHVSEGAFPGFMGFWMSVYGLAGPGQSKPSTDWAPSQPARFCQSA